MQEKPFLTDILPWETQVAIRKAAEAWIRREFGKAEDFRNAVGYSVRCEPTEEGHD